MGNELERLKQALFSIRDTFIRIFEDFAKACSEFIDGFKEGYKKAENRKKIEDMNKALWMYPPVVESEIHPFVFDERCEKCAKKAVHKRRYVSLSELLLTECIFCGATWWQRTADYNATIQFKSVNFNITTVAGGGGSNGGRFSGGGGNKTPLTQEDLDLSEFKDDGIDAFRYFKDDFFKRAGSTEKDEDAG